ncbi:D-alanyl-D-alanine carboxypeptidase/D-alanyl-D-alanine-endopeptidase [Maritimibacter sp. DP1N21-5]|uniref:D-alanyl-D-alanine carboxypeptidase/D-alanyl-D-alanine endopeptidase n=1 Tax=Maritimibacter sp. DP1N21-5 TaxID=2836867 RepID=UPI001C46972C|nr:D-alanyl-D-alanine carboxypeptidase/D-alanyl-D-alanine-endopeptidase [Maritimibacter sp. DP1N21-5]MBV7409286.1 D-alanyl-D-alanine carboxypeptidase/D-alanyl-D-alanine-endopeptidase [Maritimibacter sp. DP1N21-5]
MRGISRRFFLSGLASTVAGAAVAEAPLTSIRPPPRGTIPSPALVAASTRSAPQIDALIAEAQLGGDVGFVVADAKTGVILEEHNGATPMPPASVAKAVTALYAFDTLGMGQVFPTQLIATGPISNGQLRGDLILVGSGDPTLDTDGLADMAQALKAKGVTSVSGSFKVFGGALPYVRSIDPEQPEHLGYNPAVMGINLNYNRVHFEWARAGNGYSVAMDGRSDRYRPAVQMARMSVVNRDLPVYTYKAAGMTDEWTVAATALGNGGSRWLPVRRPDLYAGEVFQALASVHGIKLPRPEPATAMPAGTPIVQHNSADVSTIAKDMLKWSTNLTAEVLGLSASAKRGTGGSLAASARGMSDWMRQGLGAKSASFHDHSGLSDQSRVSAEDMVRMLAKIGPGGALHSHMKEVAVRGADGNTIAEPPYRIHAKTGTLNFVSSLAGYTTAADGNVLAFAIFTGDVARRRALSKAEMEMAAGAKSWSGRSRMLQQKLISRWVTVYA